METEFRIVHEQGKWILFGEVDNGKLCRIQRQSNMNENNRKEMGMAGEPQ